MSKNSLSGLWRVRKTATRREQTSKFKQTASVMETTVGQRGRYSRKVSLQKERKLKKELKACRGKRAVRKRLEDEGGKKGSDSREHSQHDDLGAGMGWDVGNEERKVS